MTTMESARTAAEIVAPALAAVRQYAAQGESDRQLAPEAVAALIDAGIFRVWAPRALGGLELDPVTGLEIFEAIAHADGSAGWVASNSAHAVLIGQMLSEQGAAELMGDPRAIIALSGTPAGMAVQVDGGLRLTGQWPFGSGCHYATAIFVAAILMDGDVPRMGPDGGPVVVGAFFPAADVEIVDHWQTVGLRGTGSHDLRVTGGFVPAHRTVTLAPFDNPGPAYQGPLYRMGMWLDGARIAICALGIARAALEAFVTLATTKTAFGMQTVLADRSVVQDQVARAQARIEAGRAAVLRATEDAWRTVQGGGRIVAHGGIPLGLAASYGVELAVEAVDLLQGVAGTTGIRDEHPFQQYFRDVHTLNQHALASAARFESLGKLILGRQSDWLFHYL